MSYRNKTYVIFDGDNDMWAYAYMKGWVKNDRIDFNFFDAHDIKPLTKAASKETVKRRLRERFTNAKQVIVLIGDHTKDLFEFVRWELELALSLELPIVAVNLNKVRGCDFSNCPPILRDEYVVHVSFEREIIRHALDNFPEQFTHRKPSDGVNLSYTPSVYASLGL